MNTDNTTNDDAGSESQSEGSDGQPSLDQILADFDKEASGAEGSDKEKPVTRAELEALQQQMLADKDAGTINDIIEILGEKTGANRLAIRGFLVEQSEDNPEILKVLDLARTNKSKFKEAVNAMVPTLNKQLKEFGADEGDDGGDLNDASNSLAAAVRGSRTTRTDGGDAFDEDWTELSDVDFAMKSRQVLRAAERGQLS